MTDQQADSRPLVLITGGAGRIGSALTHCLIDRYQVIALDLGEAEQADASYTCDLTSADSVRETLQEVARQHGSTVAAVIHLAAYFDFTGEPSELYDKVNVQGTRNLLNALRVLEVERFIYSSTMLVHQPGVPGSRITEQTPLGPTWAYPQSKAETEEVIRQGAGDIPYTLLRLAGLYDDQTCVPTLAHQIARIYESTLKSHLYSGNTNAGQAFVHLQDMMHAFVRTVDRRLQLPKENIMLVGEPRSESYEALQNRIGALIHGEKRWQTLRVPAPIAKAGALVEERAEPVVPDDIDHGEKPFIRPFMIDMASDHYELDTARAAELLGWRARHQIHDTLQDLVENLKHDPLSWYQANGITPPDWVVSADKRGLSPDRVLEQHKQNLVQEHNRSLWAHFLNIAVGGWLLTSPGILGYAGTAMGFSDMASGLLLMIFAFISLSWRHSWARFVCAGLGFWLLLAPLLWWTDSAAAYLNGTLTGMLAIGFAALVRPAPGVSPLAATSGPSTPPGWDNNPSSWFQRMPIIVLAFVGFFISRYLAAYQLGHIDAAWEPFFAASVPSVSNATEQIITSDLSEAWPIPDAGLGGMVYALEILLGLVGSTCRWRTMPWLVALFGLLIVPLGVVSITFVIIQPILIGPLCTLCLIGAVAMLLQIAYAFNELVATGEFLARRRQAGASILTVLFSGDTDEGDSEGQEDNFQRSPLVILREATTTGLSLPWNLGMVMLLGLSLMLTRTTLGNTGAMANWDHLLGALIITVAIIALAETARTTRWLLIPLALPLLFTPLVYGVGWLAMTSSIVTALVVMVLTVRRGPVYGCYGSWNRMLW